MPKEVKQTGSFVATDEQGKSYEVLIFTTFHVLTDMDGEERAPGMKSLKLRDGRGVRKVEDGIYETAERPPLNLRSADPNAI